MTNQQLLDYIKQQKQEGIDNEQIKQLLLANGWQTSDIEAAFNESQTPAQPKKKKWKKIVLITVGVLIIGFLSLPVLPRILNLFTKDIAPIDDSSLQLQKVSVADSDNAHFDLVKLSDVIYEPEDKFQTIADMIAGKTWDNQLAEELISKNSQAFAYFAEAVRKPKYQNPEVADPANSGWITSTPVRSLRQMARLSTIRAIYLAKQGKDKEALDEALNSVIIGQKIQDSQVPLVEYITAISVKVISLETVQKIIPSSKLTSAELKQYAQGLDKFYKNEDGLIMAFKSEYHIASWAVDSFVSGDTEAFKLVVGEEKSLNPEIIKKMKDFYYFRPNKTKLLFAELARENIEKANKPCGEIKATGVKRLAPTNVVKMLFEENAIGKLHYDLLALNLAPVITKKCQDDLLVGATQAMIAIKAFKNDTNNYPASLNELISNYLSSVPQDPFDGKSLKYSAIKKILYSIGEDLQDSGGSTGDHWKKMADPTFILNF